MSYNCRYRTRCPGAEIALQNPPAPGPQPHTQGLLPAVATGLTDQDRRRIKDALDHSVSANTRGMYAYAWRSFEEWAQPCWLQQAKPRNSEALAATGMLGVVPQKIVDHNT